MRFQRFRVNIDGQDSVVLEAPNEGAAVEFWLVCHGMFGYGDMPDVKVVGNLPDHGYSQVEFLKIMRGCDPVELQKHHVWMGKQDG